MAVPQKEPTDWITSYFPDRLRTFVRGNILFWQGDPVDRIFAIQKGAVKISSISSAGKIYSHGILGAGHLLGVSDYFLDGIHETTAEVVEKSQVVEIPLRDFQDLAGADAGFSAHLMRELAKETRSHSSKAQDLSFLDAQQRLMHSLIDLADEHGLSTPRGIEINVNVTHADFAELINANRTTITLCLQELKKLGYIQTEGRRIILIPVEQIHLLDQLRAAVVCGGVGEAADLTAAAITQSIDPVIILNVLMNGMKDVDRKYSLGEMDVHEIMWSSTQMKEALPLVEAAIQVQNIPIRYLGRIVFGTVEGDVHDIGKIVVSMLLRARGFEVIELGVNVSTEQFVSAVREYQPGILAMSALLTTTQNEMKQVIEALCASGLRDRVKVMIGGAPTTPKYARDIGADGYSQDARGGVELAWGWCVSPAA